MNYYDMTIKGVISEKPKIGAFLAANGVDCVSCSVGTCLLKDVLDVHNFSGDKKKAIMSQIDRIINGEEAEITPISVEKHSNSAGFCAPIQQLVDEHKNILRLLDLGEYIGKKKRIDGELTEILKKTIFYVRNYADMFHHAKEEKILFTKVSPDTDVIKVMLAEHEMGRTFIRLAGEGVESGDQNQIKEALLGYVDLLRMHIKKEDKILYPWFEKMLSDEQKTEMQREFEVSDSAFDEDMSDELLRFLDENYC